MRRKVQPIDSFERSGARRREAPSLRQGASGIRRRQSAGRRRHPSPHAGRRRIAAFLLLACAAVVAVVIGIRLNDYHQARIEYAGYAQENVSEEMQAMPMTGAPPPAEEAPAPIAPEDTATPVPSPSPKPFYSEAVRRYMRQNGDTVAAIDVLDTAVQYPVVQGKDNEYYVTHTFAGKRRAAGAIFMDVWNSADFSDFNTVIYGHNMKDGSMFSGLRDYRRQSFFSAHRYIEITLLESKRVYKVFAAYVVEDDFDFRGFANTTQTEKSAFIRQINRRSEMKAGAEATADDSLLTLVTCTGGDHDWLWIVHAVLVDEITARE